MLFRSHEIFPIVHHLRRHFSAEENARVLQRLAAHAHRASDVLVLVSTGPMAALLAALTLACSLLAFLMMNRWQPFVDATTAGIVYCTEPLFATLFALFLPALLARGMGIGYANETATPHLLLGGSLITVANLLIALQPEPPAAQSAG